MKKRKIERVSEKDHFGDLSLDINRRDPESGDDLLSERIACLENDANYNHPSPEQLLIREATKYLTPKQKKVWELWNYDKLTQDEIAKKLNMGQANVSHSIKAIEKRIAKWVKSNLGAYKLLKGDLGE